MKAIALTLLLLFIAGAEVSGQQVIWNKSRPLTYADFRGEPRDTTSAAATCCQIGTRVCKRNLWNGKITIAVEAIFYPDSSWYAGEKMHALTLKHEQGHFDIVEWYSRKLRSIIEGNIKNVSDYNRYFQSACDKLYLDYFLAQQKYELETSHGTNEHGQQKWDMFIQEQLDSLEAYKEVGCQKVK